MHVSIMVQEQSFWLCTCIYTVLYPETDILIFSDAWDMLFGVVYIYITNYMFIFLTENCLWLIFQ